MPIQEQNIVFLRSQIMDDVPEGGGAATGQVIPDGVMNNVFEDISDLDRAMGRFNLRKIFLGVRALNTDLYGGAKLVITQLPEDDAVGYTLFTTNDAFDNRSQAQNRVEAYLFKGPMWHGALMNDHIFGMKAVTLIQREDTALPPIGKTLCLVSNEGLSTEKEQYIRVVKVTVTRAEFTDVVNNEEFVRWLVRLDLADPLRFDFAGHEVNRADSYSYAGGKARVRDTVVADATRFFGTQPLVAAAAVGDRQVVAQSQFAHLVPAAQTETALVGQAINPELFLTLSGGTRTVTVPQQAHTLGLDVTAENRALNWASVLLPRPGPNALRVSFRAQGNWYSLIDNGSGALIGGNPSDGSGAINYTTGDVVVTLGALPDAGSQILFAWASPAHYTVRSGANAQNDPNVRFSFQLQKAPLQPATLVLNWMAGANARTAAADVNGVITGHATGTVDHQTGAVQLQFTQLPTRNSVMTAAYSWLRPADENIPYVFTVTRAAHQTTSHVAPGVSPASIRGSVVFGYTRLIYVDRETGALEYRTFPDNVSVQGYADGTIRTISQRSRFDRAVLIEGDQIVGTYDSVTGNITWFGSISLGWVAIQVEKHNEGTDTFAYAFGDTVPTEQTEPHPISAVIFRLLPNLLDQAVPNSVRFVLGGHTYTDASGVILNASSVVSGTIAYATGEITLTWWIDGSNVSPNVTSLLAQFGQSLAEKAFFRTLQSPILPQSLVVRAVRVADGTELIGTSDEHGEIIGQGIRGQVNFEFGTAFVEFGFEKPIEGQVDPEWVPYEMDASTIRYTAVAVSYLPLPAEIIGVDGVRLPSDGRVPIYAPGDVVMVMHPAETAPVTPTLGVPVPCGRSRVAWVRVIDANGDTITDGYTLNRGAGTVTFTTAPDHPPVTIRHTIADLRLVTDVQISGQITLARELSHNFPAEESLVGSCLLFGDRRARISAIWDQVSWNNTWADGIVGNPATATLNTIDFPIEVTNEGADTDRWVFRVINATSHAWELISERRGLVWSGTYAPGGDDVAPINPRTRVYDESTGTWVGGVPYMTIPGMANGGGWAAGNVVRINTIGAIADFWIARSVGQSDEPPGDGADGCEIYALGNIDRP